VKLLALLAAALLSLFQANEDDVWGAAKALKLKAAYAQAATAFENFPKTFPLSARANEALVEAGVCWFSGGKASQVLHRNTPLAQQQMDKALAHFDRVVAEHAKEPIASRAAYMRGTVFYFGGQLEKADAAYSRLLAEFATDPLYVEKSLEFRAKARIGMLRAAPAIADLERLVKDFPKSTRLADAQADLDRARTYDKPAPVYEPEAWASGEPAPLQLLGGHVVALYFYATWCPNCAKDEPFVLDLKKRFGPQGVTFVGVTDHNRGQTPADIRKHAEEHSFGFSIFQDNGQTSLKYGVATIPHVALIDRAGRLRWSDHPNALADSTIEALLRE
jgi:tetratricopeptide (TPR) repeat protein